MPLSGGKKWCSFSIRSSSDLLATRTGIKSHISGVQISAGFAFKCHWVPQGVFGMQKPVLFSVPVVSTFPPKVAWSFELYLYTELTVPQMSHCCPLGRLVSLCQLSNPFYFALFQLKVVNKACHHQKWKSLKWLRMILPTNSSLDLGEDRPSTRPFMVRSTLFLRHAQLP